MYCSRKCMKKKALTQAGLKQNLAEQRWHYRGSCMTNKILVFLWVMAGLKQLLFSRKILKITFLHSFGQMSWFLSLDITKVLEDIFLNHLRATYCVQTSSITGSSFIVAAARKNLNRPESHSKKQSLSSSSWRRQMFDRRYFTNSRRLWEVWTKNVSNGERQIFRHDAFYKLSKMGKEAMRAQPKDRSGHMLH